MSCLNDSLIQVTYTSIFLGLTYIVIPVLNSKVTGLSISNENFFFSIVDISAELFLVILLLLPVLLCSAVSVDRGFSPVYYCCGKFHLHPASKN